MNVKEVLFELNDCQRVMDALEEEIELGGNVVLSNQDAKRTLEIVKKYALMQLQQDIKEQ